MSQTYISMEAVKYVTNSIGQGVAPNIQSPPDNSQGVWFFDANQFDSDLRTCMRTGHTVDVVGVITGRRQEFLAIYPHPVKAALSDGSYI